MHGREDERFAAGLDNTVHERDIARPLLNAVDPKQGVRNEQRLFRVGMECASGEDCCVLP